MPAPHPGAHAAPAALAADAAAPTARSRISIDRIFVGATCLAALAFVCTLGLPFLTGRVPVFRDHGALYLPLRIILAQCLAAGADCAWLSSVNSGYPFAATEIGLYHPLRYLFYSFLPIDRAYALEVVLPYLAIAAGFALFLRSHVGLAAASGAAFIATFSILSLQFAVFPHLVLILAHIPWLWWATELALRDRPLPGKLAASAAIALLTGSQLLLVHAQAAWFSLLAVGGYTLTLALTRRLDRTGFAAIAGGHLLGLAIGFAQVYALYEALEGSTRASTDPAELAAFALTPRALVPALSPALFAGRSWGEISAGTTFGTVPLVLALGFFAAPATDRSTRTMLAWFGAALAGSSLWLAFGYAGYLYRLQALLPIVGKFRAPDRTAILAQLGLTLMAAVALARLFEWVRARRAVPWKRLIPAWALVALSSAIAFAAARGDTSGTPITLQTSHLTGPLLMLAAVLGLSLALRGHRSGLLLLLAAAVVESAAYGLLHERGALQSWRDAPEYRAWFDGLAQTPDRKPARIFARDFYGIQLALTGNTLVHGYLGGLEPARRLPLDSLAALQASGAAWVFHRGFGSAAPIEGLRLRSGFVRVPRPVPRLRLVQASVPSRAENEDIRSIDVHRHALVSARILPGLEPGARPGEVTILRDTPGHLYARVRTYGRELLVFAESFDRSWTATVDGTRSIVRRVNGDYLGTVLNAGDHAVRFDYVPRRQQRAELVSGAGAIGALLLALAALALRRRQRLVHVKYSQTNTATGVSTTRLPSRNKPPTDNQ